MTKITLNDLSTILGNEQSAINLINANNAKIETASDNTLSRDGTSPNQMLSSLDMNSFRILNCSDAINSAEPATYGQVLSLVSSFTDGGAPNTASYITLGTDPSLTSERVLTAGTGITLVDGGAGGTLIISSSATPTGAALTKVDDTNVTLTLGGSPTIALLNASSITVGWTGTLSAARGGTGIGSLGTGIATWLGTPSSANLASAVTDETGSGLLVFGTSPALTTPVLTSATVTTKISPTLDDGAPLGDTTHNFSDLFLASGAVVNWNAGDVTLTHSANHLRFAGASTGYSFDAAAIKSTTSTPVTIATLTPAFQCLGTTAGTTIGFLSGRWSADANGPFYYMYKSRNATINTHTIVQSGDTLGGLWWAGDDGSAESFAAHIRCDVDGTPGVNDMPGKIVFATSSDGTNSPTDRATLNSTGTWSQTGATTILSGTAVPAGGTAGNGYQFSSTANLGVYFGSGAPTLSAAQGSIYLRTDGGANTRIYSNNNGTTGWSPMTG